MAKRPPDDKTGRVEVPFDLGLLEERIGYRFKDRHLLEQAVTHVSAIGQGRKRLESYQRLEFLGDRVLGLVISELLYSEYPDAPEGEMSRRLADLVRKETCADISIKWSVGDHLRLGTSETGAGEVRNTAILGDVCEAVIGAVFVDGGYSPARKLIKRDWLERLKSPKRPLRDAKTTLQEWAQARGLEAPTYKEIQRSGPAHAPKFTVVALVEGFDEVEATGPSKRASEQAAAREFMRREGVGT